MNGWLIASSGVIDLGDSKINTRPDENYSVPNCSAILVGRGSGSITPPEPVQRWWYLPPDSPIKTEVALAMPNPYCGARPASSGDSHAFWPAGARSRECEKASLAEEP